MPSSASKTERSPKESFQLRSKMTARDGDHSTLDTKSDALNQRSEGIEKIVVAVVLEKRYLKV